MKELSFVWDETKNRVNQAKHDGIDFDEAKTVFYDEHGRIVSARKATRKEADAYENQRNVR